jgi:hypothetical protein
LTGLRSVEKTSNHLFRAFLEQFFNFEESLRLNFWVIVVEIVAKLLSDILAVYFIQKKHNFCAANLPLEPKLEICTFLANVP